jgi:hypothetical protein
LQFCVLLVFGAQEDSEMRAWVAAIDGAAKAEKCSAPQTVRHKVHISFDTETGAFQGIPPEWRALLEASGISNEEVESNPAQVMKVLDFENNRRDTVTKSARMPEAESLPTEGDLFLLEDPHTVYFEMRKIGQGCVELALCLCVSVSLCLCVSVLLLR